MGEGILIHQTSYIKLTDRGHKEKFITVWCPNDQMALFINKDIKLTMKQKLLKKLVKRRRNFVKKLRKFFNKPKPEDDMDFCCYGN
ncbi:9383_t:CDS:2 [Diversispora eburnea]|uniref:9383_t:CDS:1 n=1 Tax=Diversispora eburnea TaxID=1213867 RepID=A0A9N9B028_9GLOM|nr:9383_t:CDS:2 [Diversispora eburnea]